jgi:hypothetical protein
MGCGGSKSAVNTTDPSPPVKAPPPSTGPQPQDTAVSKVNSSVPASSQVATSSRSALKLVRQLIQQAPGLELIIELLSMQQKAAVTTSKASPPPPQTQPQQKKPPPAGATTASKQTSTTEGKCITILHQLSKEDSSRQWNGLNLLYSLTSTSGAQRPTS